MSTPTRQQHMRALESLAQTSEAVAKLRAKIAEKNNALFEILRDPASSKLDEKTLTIAREAYLK